MDAGRNSFYESLSELSPIKEVIYAAYEQRRNRNKSHFMLGEYTPWLLKDLLSDDFNPPSSRIVEAWMHLHVYMLLIDDMIDEDCYENSSSVLIASNLLLVRGLGKIQHILSKSPQAQIYVDECFSINAIKIIAEIQDQKSTKSEDSYNETIGTKAEILKVCGACLLCENGMNSWDEKQFVTVDLFLQAMQLLDDLTDWKEDWRQHNLSPLLKKTLRHLDQSEYYLGIISNDLVRRHILSTMIKYGVLESHLKEVSNCLNSVLHKIQNGSLTELLVEHWIDQVHEIEQEILDINRLISIKYSKSSVEYSWKLDEETLIKLDSLDSKIQVVAQSW